MIALLLACAPPAATSWIDKAGPTDDRGSLWFVEGGSFLLGEDDPEQLAIYAAKGEAPTVIPATTVTLSDFWMDRFPFPGVEGANWFTDGLNQAGVVSMAEALEPFGRRPCTVSELLYAAAGPDNHRHPYGDGSFDPDACDGDDQSPQDLGSHPSCESALGLMDFQVRSTWATLDTAMATLMDVTGSHAIWGGTSREDTFYAPNNFGFHQHDPGEEPYLDDGFRLCADAVPTDEIDASYAKWLSDARIAGNYAWIVSPDP